MNIRDIILAIAFTLAVGLTLESVYRMGIDNGYDEAMGKVNQ